MSTSKKSSETVTPSTSNATVNPVPTDVSTPPEGWVEPARLGKKGRRPRFGLGLVASTVADELRVNAPAITQELGPKAIDPLVVAAALDLAHQWDTAAAKAASFDVYARAQRNASWDAAIKHMEGLKPGVQFAVARDATFADRFPDVAKTFAPPPRKRKKKADAVAAEPTSPAAPAAIAPKA